MKNFRYIFIAAILVFASCHPVLSRAAMNSMPTLMGRAAELEELVDVILFMCSDNASFITGTNHVVDGGRLCMYKATY